MKRVLTVLAFGFFLGGCGGAPDPTQEPAIYEAAIGESIAAPNKGDGFFLFVDGKDPAPELLTQVQKKWPKLQPGSKLLPGKADSINVSNLEWIDRDTVELRHGHSNGKDGHIQRLRLSRKNGIWSIADRKIEAVS